MATSFINYVGPPNATFGIAEQGNTVTDSVGNTWLCTARGLSGQPGTTWIQIGSPSTDVITAPPASASVSVTPGTAVQNTTGGDAGIGTYLFITNASTATIGIGVGTTSAPTLYPVLSSFTSSVNTVLPLYAHVPNNYYFLVKATSGSIAATANGVWFPV